MVNGLFDPPEAGPSVPDARKARVILKEVFGYDDFKPLQETIITRVVEGLPTLALLPTGGGKSLCYQIPSLIRPGLTLVVSPLIALMKDQVDQLEALGVPVVCLNSSMAASDYQTGLDRIRKGQARLLYLAPESLFSERIKTLFSRVGLSTLVIDEAHCISEWGHDFRPEYRRLAEIRRQFPDAACLALTATATERVREDIRRTLDLPREGELIGSFDRPNIFLEVRQKSEPREQVLEFMASHRGESGIIYCFSRKNADDLATWLVRQGIKAGAYHAGLADEERHRVQEAFLRDDLLVVVATVAFGMGINKPDVRFVIHYDMPKSLENYYQEVGRGGRDGLPARGLFLYSWGDYRRLESFLGEHDRRGHFIPQEKGDKPDPRKSLRAVSDFAESAHCRRAQLLRYFGEEPARETCGSCDTCVSPPVDKVDCTLLAQKFLSCVFRTGERFGAAYVAEVITGSKSERILEREHEQLSTWGIGTEYDKTGWVWIGRQLEQGGYLDRDEHGVLSLTHKARNSLKNRTTIVLAPVPVSTGKEAKKALRAKLVKAPRGGDMAEGGLFDELRRLRKSLADDANVPPYVVFSDKTLYDMAEKKPGNLDQLMEVFGVGKTKASRYGEAFLSEIKRWQER